jgi:hypothetical protein
MLRTVKVRRWINEQHGGEGRPVSLLPRLWMSNEYSVVYTKKKETIKIASFSTLNP